MKKLIYTLLFLSMPMTAMANTDLKIGMLNDKISRMEQDIVILQRKSYQQNGANKSLDIVNYQPNANLDDLYTKIAEQSAVIQAQTAKIEHLEFAQKQLESKLKQMNDDIDIRFNMLNTSAPAPQNNQTEQGAYDSAYQLLQAGKYDEAQDAFLTFMDTYKTSKLLGNANYWLGETFYARGKFDQAIGVFADGITKYKTNSKAPDNLLKLGMSMDKLGKKDDACTAFKSIESEYPKASKNVIEKANAQIKKLGC